jgi:carboxyl-terminal processing protease
VSKRRYVFESALVLVLGAAVLGSTMALNRGGGDYGFFDELIEVKSLISQRWVDVPDDKVLREGAIKGMVEALNDPYTIYVPASDKSQFNKDLTGEYVGIGAMVNGQDGWLTIVSPLEDSPAFKAGLLAGDRLVEVEGTSTQNLAMDKCVDLLMGQEGSQVHVIVERQGQKFPLTITREHIKTRNVKGFHRDPNDQSNWQYLIDPARKIAYLRLTQFTPGCAQELEKALDSVGAEKGDLKGLVLDLRGNPGGLLNEAEAIADLFLEDGVIVSTKGRAYSEKVTRAKKEGTLPNFPIALLINGQSASASEVLAGALTENNRAIAVGSRSFGKGSVQVVLDLPSGKGSELKLTEQGYYLPSGRSISRKDDAATWGVDPTEGFYVPMTDQQTTAMLEVRRKEEILSVKKEGGKAAEKTAEKPPQEKSDKPSDTKAAAAPTTPTDWSNPDSTLAALKDDQLSAAVKAVQAKVDSGQWKPTGEKGPQLAKIETSELQNLRTFHERLMRELARTEKRMDAIETASPEAKATPAKDLWPDSVDLTGGTIEVKDKDGKVIAVLDVTGNNVERWLLDADVKKKE